MNEQPFGQPVEQSFEPTVEPKKRSGDNLWKILAAVFGLIAIVLGFLLLTKKEPMTVVFVNEDNIRLEKVSKGSKVTKPDIDSEDFLGWFDGGSEFDFSKGVDKDYVLYAKFDTSNQYTVTFDTDGGSVVEAVKVKENKTVSMPATPTKAGLVFNEWTLNGEVYDFSTPVTSDITLKATWRENDNTVMVRFDSAGGSAVTSQKVPVGGTAKKPNNPSRSGYNFVEWQLDGVAYDFSKTVNSEITLKATWKEKQKVTLSFDSNGGSNVANKTVYVGEAVGTLQTPTKSGYVFKGWTLNGSAFNANSKVNGNTTVKASWQTVDEYNYDKAVAAIKAKKYEITKNGQQFPVTSNGCTITHDTVSTSVKSVTFNITCGSKSGKEVVNATVKLPTYGCTYKFNDNKINATATISGVNSGAIYYANNDNQVAEISGGKAIINNGDLSGTTKFRMKITGDQTIYTISCTKVE